MFSDTSLILLSIISQCHWLIPLVPGSFSASIQSVSTTLRSSGFIYYVSLFKVVLRLVCMENTECMRQWSHWTVSLSPQFGSFAETDCSTGGIFWMWMANKVPDTFWKIYGGQKNPFCTKVKPFVRQSWKVRHQGVLGCALTLLGSFGDLAQKWDYSGNWL